jgi:hypothetical protein
MNMCPHCGHLFGSSMLIPNHFNEDENVYCPGSKQHPRNPLSDARPLWNGQPNPHIERTTKDANHTKGIA